MKIGILTGGGDAPGLNAVIRAVVIRGAKEGHEFVGIKDGWKGLLTKHTVQLKDTTVRHIISKGGTILGTSRTNPFKSEEDTKKLLKNIKALKLDALVCIGGDDTLGVAAKLHKLKVNVVGVPKTIDNDLSGTDFTFGFDTAVQNVTESIDKLTTTTEAHHRVMVVETMGRHAGWIAAYGGLSGGADIVLVPEESFNMEDICKTLKEKRKRGEHFSLVVVAEGAVVDMKAQEKGKAITSDESLDAFGHVKLGGIGEYLAKELEKCTGFETRHVVLGHLQRGGSPTARDRVLATMYGYHAMGLVMKKKFGRMVCIRGNDVTDISIKEASSVIKTLDKNFLKMMKEFF